MRTLTDDETRLLKALSGVAHQHRYQLTVTGTAGNKGELDGPQLLVCLIPLDEPFDDPDDEVMDGRTPGKSVPQSDFRETTRPTILDTPDKKKK